MEEEEGSAEYLTSNCLLLTYVNGAAARLVDQHFDRALNTGTSADEEEEQQGGGGGRNRKDGEFRKEFGSCILYRNDQKV